MLFGGNNTMKKHFLKTVMNCEEYLKNSNHSFSAKMIGDDVGGISVIHTDDTSFFVVVKIEEDAEIVLMETSANLYCCKEARPMLSEYITKINAQYKGCNFRLADNGYLHVYTDQKFDSSAPVSVETFDKMEYTSIILLDTYKNVLSKIGALRLLSEEESNPAKMLETQQGKILSMLIDEIEGNNHISDDFKRFISRKRGHKFDRENNLEGNEKSKESKGRKAYFSMFDKIKDSDDQENGKEKGLLDELLEIPDELLEIPDNELTENNIPELSLDDDDE